MRSLDGLRIGPYELTSCIGSGGMGVVYRARDTRLDRTVAIKVLAHRTPGDPHAAERFDREGRAIAALNHPHICSLYDVGDTTLAAAGSDPEESVRFLVMEYLEGETLASRLTRGPLPLDEALRYAEQIAAALDCAHRAGIVHRDLKPGNIFLVPAGGASPAFSAKLLDFGLAKTAAAVPPGDLSATRMRSPDLTAVGTMVGTVQYMAPEQLEGKDTDPRTDLFALGAVLFEMLTGRKAFAGDSQASLMVSILDREPPRVTALQPATPLWVEQLIDWCLAKRPDQRWRSAADILRELQSPRERPVSGTAFIAAATKARSKRRLVAGGVIVLVAAAAIAVTTWRRSFTAASPPFQRAALAVLPLLSVDSATPDDTHLGVGIADAILTKLANIHSIRVRPTSAIVAFEGRAVDPAAAARELQVDHVLAGTMRRLGDAYRFNLQLIRASDGLLVWGRQIDVSRRDLFGVEDQVTAEVVAALQLQISSGERARLSQRYTENADAYDEYLQGRALLANYSDSNMRQAIEHFERALRIDPGYVLADAGMATAAGISSVRFAYDLKQATEWGRRAEEYARRASRHDADLAEVHLALASAAGTLYRNFDWPTVIREADAALAQNPNLDLAHSALARAFYHIGQLEWSDRESERAEEVSGGTNNIEVSRVHLYNKFLAGQFDEARRMAEALIPRTDAAVIRQYLGLSVFYAGDRQKGQALLAAVRHPDGRVDQRSQASLAGVLAANGQREDAERTLQAVVDSGYMDHHVAYAIGAASAQLGRPEEAVKWLRTAGDTGFPCYPWIARDSLLDPIRSDPAFQAFMTGIRSGYEEARRTFDHGSRRQ